MPFLINEAASSALITLLPKDGIRMGSRYMDKDLGRLNEHLV
jgi:hypothetical protein